LVGVFSFSGYARVTGISVGANSPPHRHPRTRGAADADAGTGGGGRHTKNKLVPWSNSSLPGEVYLAEK
jgi:hypothetical protein